MLFLHKTMILLKQFSTTVVDRRSVEANRAFDSGSGERGIDVFFAIGTSKEDAQRRAIRAKEGE